MNGSKFTAVAAVAFSAAGFCGTLAAESVTSPYATGGDYVYTIDVGGGLHDYVHVFSNRADAASFKNVSGKPLKVRCLAVGGGGSGGTGGTTANMRTGGGGGGGGGVIEDYYRLATDEEWSILVGIGGKAAPVKYTNVDTNGTATAISNGVGEIVYVPFGGNGCHSSSDPAKSGAAGGGAGYYQSAGAAGTFISRTILKEGALHKGGDMAKLVGHNAVGTYYNQSYVPAGGGGADGDGKATTMKETYERLTAGTGGAGMASDITGETVYYGAGGGGGGWYSTNYLCNVVGNAMYGGVGGSEWAGNGASGAVIENKKSYTLATSGINGTGSGGGGGITQYPSITSPLLVGGDGGDGIVIIRYHADDAWQSAENTPSFDAVGADGEVTIRVCGQVEKADGKTWLVPGLEAMITAEDSAGNLFTGFEDNETGEFIRGRDIIRVTPQSHRSYTAVFGKQWTYCADELTLTDGDWQFSIVTNDDGEAYICDCTKARADSVLNLAAPMFGTNGVAYHPKYVGRGDKTTLFVPSTICNTIRLFVAEGMNLRPYTFRSDYGDVTVRGSLSMPRSSTISGAALLNNVCLTNVFFEGDGLLGQYVGNGRTFKGCSALRRIGTLPRSYATIGGNDFASCSELVEFSAPYSTKIADQAFYYCNKLTELHLPNVTTISSNAFYHCDAMRKIVFSTNAVTFTESAYYSSVFYDLQKTCRFEFPGKAPIIKKCTDYTYKSKVFPCTGYVGFRLFGKYSNVVKLYGSWRNDPEGWKKILDEIGTTEFVDPDGKALTPPTLDKANGERRVRGMFYWTPSVDGNAPCYGWLIDTKMPGEPEGTGMMMLVR